MNSLLFGTHEIISPGFVGGLLLITFMIAFTIVVFCGAEGRKYLIRGLAFSSLLVFGVLAEITIADNAANSSKIDSSMAVFYKEKSFTKDEFVSFNEFNRKMTRAANLSFTQSPNQDPSDASQTLYDVSNLKSKQKYYSCSLRFTPVKNSARLDAVVCGGNNILAPLQLK